MSTPYISQTQYGKNEVFGLQVARGQIQGHTAVIVFGYNPDVDTAEESVWPDGGAVPHPTVASVLKISSSSANDTSAGTGARTVHIEGLNGDYAVVSETVTLNGQTAVNTVNSYLYVNSFYVITAGSGRPMRLHKLQGFQTDRLTKCLLALSAFGLPPDVETALFPTYVVLLQVVCRLLHQVPLG